MPYVLPMPGDFNNSVKLKVSLKQLRKLMQSTGTVMTIMLTKPMMPCTSVVDPDPHSGALLICIGNTDPDAPSHVIIG